MHRIAIADHELVSACMARQGFTYRAAPPTNADTPHPQLFGRENPDGPQGPGPSEVPTTNQPGYDLALLGDPRRRVTARGDRMTVSGPAGGCIAEAKARLLSVDRVRWMRTHILLFEAAQDAREDLDSDGHYRAALQRWRECARASGFDWSDPRAALTDHTERAATVDLSCKQRTGYLPTAYARLAAAQQARLNRAPDLLSSWMSMLRKQEQKARAVTGA